MHIANEPDTIATLFEESTDARVEPQTGTAIMTEPNPDQPPDVVDVDDDPFRPMPRCVGSPYRFDERTGSIVFLSPPGTPPVTSEDVKRWLEEFP
jgi:hypothetical protein